MPLHKNHLSRFMFGKTMDDIWGEMWDCLCTSSVLFFLMIVNPKFSAGEYQYIDVVFDEEEESGDEESSDRYIVDIDFQAQFKIARPTQQYEAVLKSLPTVFVGTSTKLKRFLEIMSDAAKVSLKQNAMHLPPWRTLDYMSAKWFSNFERKSKDLLMSPMFTGPCSLHWRDNQLRCTKVSLFAEVKGSPLSNLPCGRNSRANVILKRAIL